MKKLAILLLLSHLAAADPDVPGNPWPDPNLRQPGNGWLLQNGLSLYREQYLEEDRFHFWAFPSFFERDLKLRSPRLSFQHADKLWLDAGSHLGQLDAFISPLILQGGRLNYDFDPLRLDLAVGTTGQFNLPLAIQGLAEFDYNALALSYRLGERGFARLASSGWTPANQRPTFLGLGRPHSSRVVSLEVRPDLRQLSPELSLQFGYGLELEGSPAVGASEKKAHGWQVAYNGDDIRFEAQEESRGRAYGPGHFENFFRGQSNLNVNLNWSLSDQWELQEGYRRFSFAGPVEASRSFASQSEFVSHTLAYHNQPQHVSATLGYTQGQLQGPAGSLGNNQQDSWQAQVQWRPRSNLGLGAGLSRVESRGQGFNASNLQTNLQADWGFAPDQRFLARVGLNQIDNRNFQGRGLSWGLGYERIFAHERGRFALDYQTNSFGFVGGNTRTMRASLAYRPSARLNLFADYSYFDFDLAGTRAQQGKTLGLSYLLDRHQEIAFHYQDLPFANFGSFVLPSITNRRTWVGLELRQSFDGPLQEQWSRRLEPSVRVEVQARALGSSELRPVANARLEVNGELLGKTNAEGQIHLRPQPGPAKVRLDLSESGPFYKLEGPEQQELLLEEGSEEELSFVAQGYSGIRVTTWNDFFEQGQLPEGYTPVENVPLLLDGRPYRSDAAGQLCLAELPPGPHSIVVDRAQLAPGLEAMGTGEVLVSIEPGQEAQLQVPIRGYSWVEGQIQTLGGLTLPTQGLELLVNGKPVGRTDGEGRFRAKVPTGNLKLGLALEGLPADAFLLEPQPLRLEPGASGSPQLIVSRKATLVVQLRRRGQPLLAAGLPVELEGVEYLYSNSQGQLDFGAVPPGTYRVTILSESLPEGYRIVGPATTTLELQPGQSQQLFLEVEKR